MIDYEEVLIIGLVGASIITGWLYGRHIRYRPFPPHYTWLSVVVGVAFTLVLYCPIIYLLALDFGTDGIDINEALILALILPCGFAITGGFQIFYQVRKAIADKNEAMEEANRYNGRR